MAKRIDTLKSGQKVTLGFYYSGQKTEEPAEFLKIEGEGESRRASFRTEIVVRGEKRSMVWDAYRYNKRWAYGTGADRLTLVSVEG